MMNTIGYLTLVVSLAVLLSADRFTTGNNKDATTSSQTAEKIVLNHNETLVKDLSSVDTGQLQIIRDAGIDDMPWVHPSIRNWQASHPQNTGSLTFDAGRSVRPGVKDSWLTAVWDFFFRGPQQPPGGDCDEFGCGSNHNETLVKDVDSIRKAASIGETDVLRVSRRDGGEQVNGDGNAALIEATQDLKATPHDSWLNGIWDLLFRGGQQPPGGDCDEFGCGMNHNETLVKDVESVEKSQTQPVLEPASDTPLTERFKKIGAARDIKAKAEDSWLKSVWDLLFRGVQQPPGGDCDDFGCGMNHNERLVKGGTDENVK